MKPEEITRMSFWYPKLAGFSIESRSFRCPEGLVRDLMGALFSSLEGDPFAVSAGLLDRYPRLREFLAGAVAEWGGVFVRADKASPKDSCLDFSYTLPHPFEHGLAFIPGTQRNACIALSPEVALALIVSSERVMRLGDPSVLWVRRPTMLRSEVRVFVKDLRVRLISWYYPEEPLRRSGRVPSIVNRIGDLRKLVGAVRERTGLRDFTLDVGFRGRDLVIVELAPFPVIDDPYLVDPIMYREDFWDKLKEAIESNTTIVRYPTEEVVTKEVKITKDRGD